jgi:2'-5' RNA ligase
VRLFFAIELDPGARQGIAGEQRRLRTAVAGADLRWVDPEQLHLTLVFLGEVPEPALTNLREAATRPIDLPPFILSFGGVGVFPPRGAPRVLWLGALEGAGLAAGAQRAIAGRATQCGLAIERRPFRPHLTLARVRDGGRGGGARLRTEIAALAGDRVEPVARVRVNEVTLFRSLLSPKGSTYEALARAPLAGPPLQ